MADFWNFTTRLGGILWEKVAEKKASEASGSSPLSSATLGSKPEGLSSSAAKKAPPTYHRAWKVYTLR